jgi:hypothetical protein
VCCANFNGRVATPTTLSTIGIERRYQDRHIMIAIAVLQQSHAELACRSANCPDNARRFANAAAQTRLSST